jgi:hypothetical protein
MWGVDQAKTRLDRWLKEAARIMARRLAEFADPEAEPELAEETMKLWAAVKTRTMTSVLRIDALRSALEYIEANSILGDIVECGVWRGGSMMAVALTLLRLGGVRALWLYDTFSGMPPPEAVDKDFRGIAAASLLAKEPPDTSWIWAKSALDDVKAGMAETRYPQGEIRYVVGTVEATLPERMPEKIALLRLDTDWFSSTYHELIHLWPKISPGGILIIDDYGYWVGARKAVDQFFDEIKCKPFLHRIDDTGRLIIK